MGRAGLPLDRPSPGHRRYPIDTHTIGAPGRRIIVTTPQDVARTITQKGLRMFQQVQVPIIGIVENMSGFVCEHCHENNGYKKGGGRKMSEELVVPFLGELPLEPTIAADGDYGVPPWPLIPTPSQARPMP